MTVATYTRPNFTTQTAVVYKANIDAGSSVFERISGAFAPHQVTTGSPAPDLAVQVDAGAVMNVALSTPTLTEVASQIVTGFTAPSAGQHRLDRVVLDETTGVATRVAGTAVTGSPSAVAPAIASGKLPCCSVLVTAGNTAILNSMITDERVAFPVKKPARFVSTAQTITAAGSLALAHGLGSTPTLIQARLKNVTGEHGYSTNDEVVLALGNQSSASLNDFGATVTPDATNLNVRFGATAAASILILNKTTGATASLTNANWQIIFYAWVI